MVLSPAMQNSRDYSILKTLVLFSIMILFLPVVFSQTPVVDYHNISMALSQSTTTAWGFVIKANFDINITTVIPVVAEASQTRARFYDTDGNLIDTWSRVGDNMTGAVNLSEGGSLCIEIDGDGASYTRRYEQQNVYPIERTNIDWTNGSTGGCTAPQPERQNNIVGIESINLDTLVLTFEDPTPANGTTTNTNQTINMTCSLASSNITFWFSQNESVLDADIIYDNEPLVDGFLNYTTGINTSSTWYYKGSCNDGEENTTTRVWTYDNILPTITVNPNNFFTTDNLSTQSPFGDTVFANITFEDETNLFGYVINITKDGELFLNFSVLNINGTTSNTFNRTLNITTLTAGRYLINLTVADAHTDLSIKDYVVEKGSNYLRYDNNIKITALGAKSSNSIKKGDRYNMIFDYDSKTPPTTKEFVIESKNKLHYIGDSNYNGHFVDWQEKKWIDFEGIGVPTNIIKVNDNKYRLIFANSNSKVDLESIGGLNERTETYSWYRGDYTAFSTNNFSGVGNTFSLNLSKETSIIDFEASLFYLNQTFDLVSDIAGDNHSLLTQAAQNQDVEEDLNITYYWFINMTQNDSSVINFNVSAGQNLKTWSLDNCTNNLHNKFNFTVFREDTGDPLAANATFIIQYRLTDFESINRSLNFEVSRSTNFTFCSSEPGLNFTGTMDNTFRAEGFEPRGYGYSDVSLAGVFPVFLILSEQAADILYVLVDSALARIEGATMNFFRVINGTTSLVFSGQSDFQGQVVVSQDQTVTYFINITHPEFPLKEFNLKPVLTSYTIKLTATDEILFQNLYQGIRYKIEPPGTVFNITDDYINFTFTLEGSNLEFWGINLTRHDFECIPATCSNVSTSSTGGSVVVRIKVNETGRFFTSLFYKRFNEPLVFINQYPNHGVLALVAGNSAIQLMQNIKDNTSPKQRAVIAAMITVVLVGIGGAVGIAGSPLMFLAVISNIFLSLPSIAFINPLFGMFVSIVGIIIFSLANVVKQ